jgi:hypothetical protein
MLNTLIEVGPVWVVTTEEVEQEGKRCSAEGSELSRVKIMSGAPQYALSSERLGLYPLVHLLVL